MEKEMWFIGITMSVEGPSSLTIVKDINTFFVVKLVCHISTLSNISNLFSGISEILNIIQTKTDETNLVSFFILYFICLHFI